MVIELDMIQSLAFAVLVLSAGKFLKKKIRGLEQFCIPSPVVGGTVFAIFTLFMKLSGVLEFNFNTTLQSVFMTVFFTTVGFLASFKVLRTGGTKVSPFLLLAIILVFFRTLLVSVLR